MVKGYRGSKRNDTGGIVSLAIFSEEHSEALEYDLLTRTIYDIDDLGGELSWFALNSFIKNLKGDSSLARDLEKSTGWEDTLTTNRILADIYDLLQVINANLVGMGGRKVKVRPYPRPGMEDRDRKRIGKGAMPYSELIKWFENKRKG